MTFREFIDTARHPVFLRQERTKKSAARDAGLSLLFLGGIGLTDLFLASPVVNVTDTHLAEVGLVAIPALALLGIAGGFIGFGEAISRYNKAKNELGQ